MSARKNGAEQLPAADIDSSALMDDRSPEEVAGYIADMVLQLRNMAKEKELDFLAYLLEMSFQEAFDLSSREKKD